MATKALQKLVVAKTAEPVTLLKKLCSTGANKARIFFAMKFREQTGQTLLPRVLRNRKTQIEKCCLPCQVQPFLVAFRNFGSQTRKAVPGNQALASQRAQLGFLGSFDMLFLVLQANYFEKKQLDRPTNFFHQLTPI